MRTDCTERRDIFSDFSGGLDVSYFQVNMLFRSCLCINICLADFENPAVVNGNKVVAFSYLMPFSCYLIPFKPAFRIEDKSLFITSDHLIDSYSCVSSYMTLSLRLILILASVKYLFRTL